MLNCDLLINLFAKFISHLTSLWWYISCLIYGTCLETKKGTKKKLDAQVEDLQKDVAHLTGEKHALTTEIKDLRKATEEEKIRYLNLKADSEKLSGEIAMKRRELTEYVFSDRNSVPEVPRGTLHLGEADDILDL